jgi:hypothetical protein
MSPEARLRFYTHQESEEWLVTRKRVKPDDVSGLKKERVDFPLVEPNQLYSYAFWISKSITYRMPVLLWITEWDIWSSSENVHLYYKLRQSYGDYRLLQEAPGHLFLGHESEDLASFLHITLSNGWGGYVLTDADYVNAFLSHDHFIDFYSELDESLEEARTLWRTPRPT